MQIQKLPAADLGKTLKIVTQAFNARSAAIWILSEAENRLKLEHQYNLNPRFLEFFHDPKHWPKPGQGIVGKAFQNKRTIIKSDLLDSGDVPSEWKYLLRDKILDVQTLISHPLFIEKDHLIGVLNLYFSNPPEFRDDDFQAIRITANYLGTIVEGERAYTYLHKSTDELRSERNQLAALSDAIQALSISKEQSMRDLISDLARTIGKALGTHAIAIWKATSDRKHLKMFMNHGLAPEYAKYFEDNPYDVEGGMTGILAQAFLNRKPGFTENILKDEKVFENFSADIKSIIKKEGYISVSSFPLIVQGKSYGVLNFYFSTEHAFSKSEREILQVASHTVSIAIGNAEYRQDLKRIQNALSKTLKATEIAREHAEQISDRIQLIISNFSDGILVLSEDMRVKIINPTAENILNINKGDIINKSIYEIADALNLRSMTSELSKKVEKAFKREIGFPQDRTIEVMYVPIFSRSGKKSDTMFVLHDITREKRVEQLKTEFVSLAAHQLRTPLSAIKWTFNILMNDMGQKFTREQSDLMNVGYKSNERMIALVNDLLDITRIEEGKYINNPTPSNIYELVRLAISNRSKEAERRGISLDLVLKSKKAPILMIDKEKIMLSMHNLIDNAMFYTQRGGRIVVSIDYKDAKKIVEISVRDNGIGIPQKQQGRVFERFFRAPNAVSVHTTGTGLGLYIIKNIIEAHGGKIWFQSKENKGTVFHIAIPAGPNK